MTFSESNENELTPFKTTTVKQRWSRLVKMQKRHPSLFIKQDSVFDADSESKLIDFVLVYEIKNKKSDKENQQQQVDTDKKFKDGKREYRNNYLNNLITNGLKIETRVIISFFIVNNYYSAGTEFIYSVISRKINDVLSRNRKKRCYVISRNLILRNITKYYLILRNFR